MVAKVAGEPSLARVELFTQNAYFVFQVVQVFLVVTLASSATALIKQIQDKPADTPKILAEKLPNRFQLLPQLFLGTGFDSGFWCAISSHRLCYFPAVVQVPRWYSTSHVSKMVKVSQHGKPPLCDIVTKLYG